MARHTFGGGIADWAFTEADGVDGEDDLAQLTGSVTMTFFSAETGGSQYTDLLDENAAVVDHVTTEDGTGSRAVGQIPPFSGPEDVWEMWASANGGARKLMVATDVGTTLGPAVTTVQADLATHLGALNPHGTRVQDLDDVSAPSPSDGQALVWDVATSRWVPSDVDGVSGVVTLTGDQTVTGVKTFEPADPADSGIVLQCAPGQVGDILACFSPAGQRTGYFNEKGELRAISAAANSVGVRIKGQSGQTARITEWTDTGNNPIAWVEPDGRVRAPNLAIPFIFSVKDNVATGTGAHRIYNDTGVALQVRSVRSTVGTPPTGASLIVDVNKNGTTVFTTQANRPTIAIDANTSGKVTNMDVTTLNDGDFLTVDIDQVGSGTAGADLVVQVLCY